MRYRRVTDFIDRFQGSIESGIKADAIISTIDIVIDGAGQSYNRETGLLG